MNTPTPTSTPPGDREAARNATRRAERRGTADPQVDATAVRLALADARDMAHLEKLLEAAGIEAEFDRRGQARAVYGWRLRRQGSEEWLKASTLARDLSWPKIAHRFKTDMNDEAAVQEVKIIQKVRLDDRADDRAHDKEQDRRPAMIRNALQLRPKADLDLPKTVDNIARTDIGPVSKVMLLIGAAAVKLSAAALAALINFIRALLRRFGLMLTAAAPGSAQAQTALPFEPRYLDVESRFVPEPVTPNAIENAANELMKVADALEKNDPDLLPPGQGREELAAALVAEQSPFSIPPSNVKTVEIQGSAENKPDGLDALFSAPQEVVQPTPTQLVDDTLAALGRAVKAQADAESRVSGSPKKESEEVTEAKEKLATAESQLTARKDRHFFEKAEESVLSKLMFPSVESFSAKEIAAVAAAKALLAAASKAYPAEVPQALNVALLQARLGSIIAAELALNEQKKMLVVMPGGNAELLKIAKSKVDFFASQVKLLGHHPSTHYAKLTLKSGEDAIKSIAEKRIEIESAARREVQKALEASLQKHVPRNEFDDDDDAPGR